MNKLSILFTLFFVLLGLVKVETKFFTSIRYQQANCTGDVIMAVVMNIEDEKNPRFNLGVCEEASIVEAVRTPLDALPLRGQYLEVNIRKNCSDIDVTAIQYIKIGSCIANPMDQLLLQITLENQYYNIKKYHDKACTNVAFTERKELGKCLTELHDITTYSSIVNK